MSINNHQCYYSRHPTKALGGLLLLLGRQLGLMTLAPNGSVANAFHISTMPPLPAAGDHNDFKFGGSAQAAAAPEPEKIADNGDGDDSNDAATTTTAAPPSPDYTDDDDDDFMSSDEISPSPREFEGLHPWHFNGFHNMPFDVRLGRRFYTHTRS